MNKIFDSIIINLKKETRNNFLNQLEKNIINKKTCNQFAKYIKSKSICNKIIQISYCKQINKLNMEKRSMQKLRKFFKNTNNFIIYNFLDHKINYDDLVQNANNILKILKPILIQFINRNDLRKDFKVLDLFTAFNLITRIILILKSFLDHTFPRNSSPFINKLNNISNKTEEYIVNMEINNRLKKLISLFSMRIIYLVSHDYECLEDLYALSFTQKKIFYVGFISKLIHIMNDYTKIVNHLDIVTTNINTTLETEILNLSSETDSFDDPSKIVSFVDSYEDSIILNK